MLVEVPIKVSLDIIEKLDVKNLRSSIQYLVTLFKNDYQKHFPINVSTVAEALHIINAANSLNSLNVVTGFDKHIKEYVNDKDSTYFVTVVANYLYFLTEKLELEPSFENHPKCPDIKIIFDGQPLYIECKNPKKDILSSLNSEQNPMYDVLYYLIKEYPCNLTISYENPLSTGEINSLVANLTEKLTLVTGEGIIYNRDGVEVSVTNVGNFSSNIGNNNFSFILENRYSERNLMNIITRDGVAISFIKKGVSVQKNIAKQMKNCSKKVPNSECVVLAIQSEYLTGHPSNNIKMISQLFQPTIFTSISGVLLSNWDYNVDTTIEHQFVYINNPFARNPVKDFERLFRLENRPTLHSL